MSGYGSETAVFVPGDLVFFIDETGHEGFADSKFPVFGFGGLAVMAERLDIDVRLPWQKLRRAVHGSETAPLHASRLTRDQVDRHASAIGKFFREGKFARFGVSCSDKTVSPNSVGVNEYILGALKARILSIIKYTPATSLRIIFEETQRLRSKIERYFGDLKINENEITIPIHFYFLPKSSNDPALEVADFVAHAIGRHAHPKRLAQKSYGLDFKSIFHDRDRREVSYIHIEKVELSDQVDSNSLVKK